MPEIKQILEELIKRADPKWRGMNIVNLDNTILAIKKELVRCVPKEKEITGGANKRLDAIHYNQAITETLAQIELLFKEEK